MDIDSDMIKALTIAGYTLEQAGEIQKILNTVGVKSIEVESMTEKATEGLNAVVCYPNGLKDRNRRFYMILKKMVIPCHMVMSMCQKLKLIWIHTVGYRC